MLFRSRLALGAVAGGLTSAAVQYALTGEIDRHQVIDDATAGALLGLFNPAASVAPALARATASPKICVPQSAIKHQVTAPYKRPSGATTAAQRAAVQGKPCVKCGAETSNQVAGHKEALIKEYYETGSINTERMRRLDSVQPECPTCSAREGDMMRNSREMKRVFGL